MVTQMPPTAAGWQVELRRESFYLTHTDNGLVADPTGFGFPEDGTARLRAALSVVEESQAYRNVSPRDPSPLPWAATIDGGPVITFGLVAPARRDLSAWPPVGLVEVRYRDVPRLQAVLEKLV